MFSPAQGLEARWVFPPACFPKAGDMFSLACGSEAVGMVWLPQREVWKSVVFDLAPGMFSVDMSTLCVPRRRVAIMLPPARGPNACGVKLLSA